MSTPPKTPIPTQPLIKDMVCGPLHEGVCTHCGEELQKDSPYCYDPVCDVDYCKPCGQTLRYHRKKAMERNVQKDDIAQHEPVPATHTEANQLFIEATTKRV